MARPPLYLVGSYEIGILLGNLSRQRTYQITRRASFPEPVAELAQGQVWLGDQVEAWIAAHRGGPSHRGVTPGSPPGAGRPGFPDG
ncbi:DNA-binding protein [Actinoplanes sp. NPDC026670]|uniref:DNA-binding protein n=1 Tax=Actinoplanes sp. NPDC026670 TaxID=3154700 RepID=UPI0033EF6EE0